MTDLVIRPGGAFDPEPSVRVCDLDEGTRHTASGILPPRWYGWSAFATTPHCARNRKETRRTRSRDTDQLAVEARNPTAP